MSHCPKVTTSFNKNLRLTTQNPVSPGWCFSENLTATHSVKLILPFNQVCVRESKASFTEQYIFYSTCPMSFDFMMGGVGVGGFVPQFISI